MTPFWLLLLPIAAASGYWAASSKSKTSSHSSSVSRDYFVGLNYLLNEQPDKAVDVFIKMLEVDGDTVETHLALGNLFRRRGEVERAIRIHQNLIARPQLDKKHRNEALLALGQDYMGAGVLDRAERLFLEVVEAANTPTMVPSLNYLLDIYQQEKDWNQAIRIAMQIETVTGEVMNPAIAHYYCELAESARNQGHFEQAEDYIHRALSIDRNMVRASLLQGQLAQQAGQYKQAIRCYKRVKKQDPDYLTEAIKPMLACYEKLGNESELIDYLLQTLEDFPRITIALILSERLKHWHGNQAAIEFMEKQLRKHQSLKGINQLILLQLEDAEGDVQSKLDILKDLTEALLVDKPIYRCGHCGFAGKVLHWQCPGCKHWSTVKPIHGVEGD